MQLIRKSERTATLRLLKGLRVLFVFALAASAAFLRADMNPANDASNIEITILPSVDRGIMIDTASPFGMLDLGNLDMGVSTQTVYPATVTILGTVTNTELELSASINGGWKFDDNVATQEDDNLAVWSVFTSTNSSVMPTKTASKFDDAMDALSPASPSASFGSVRVGLANGDGGVNDRFEDGTTNMDSLAPGAKRLWWFYFRTPSGTNTPNAQKVTFILSVTPGP